VVDNLRPADDVNLTISKLRALQAELQSRDSVVHGLAASNEPQLLVRKDKVIIIFVHVIIIFLSRQNFRDDGSLREVISLLSVIQVKQVSGEVVSA